MAGLLLQNWSKEWPMKTSAVLESCSDLIHSFPIKISAFQTNNSELDLVSKLKLIWNLMSVLKIEKLGEIIGKGF